MKKSVGLLLLLVAVLLLSTACQDQTPKVASVDLSKIMGDIAAGISLPESMTDITTGDLQRIYNIDSSEYTQFAGKITNIGTLGDEIVMVEAVDASAATSIKEKMEKRYQSKLNEMNDYLPDEYKKIQDGQVVQNGNYVALLVSADQSELNKIYEGAF